MLLNAIQYLHFLLKMLEITSLYMDQNINNEPVDVVMVGLSTSQVLGCEVFQEVHTNIERNKCLSVLVSQVGGDLKLWGLQVVTVDYISYTKLKLKLSSNFSMILRKLCTVTVFINVFF